MIRIYIALKVIHNSSTGY